MFQRLLSLLILVIAPIGLGISCSKRVISDSVSGVVISGRASAGPISHGTLTVFSLKDDGNRGEILFSGSSESDGSFSIQLSKLASAIEMVITGGSYEEEASGKIVQLGTRELRARLVIDPSTRSIKGSISPFTEIAVRRSQSLISNQKTNLADAITSANLQVTQIMGLRSEISGIARPGKTPSGASHEDDVNELAGSDDEDEDFQDNTFDIAHIVPADPSIPLASENRASLEAQSALLLATLSQLALNKAQEVGLAGLDSLDVMDALAKDFQNDGKLDGKNFDQTVTLGNTEFLLASGTEELAAQIQKAQQAFLRNSRNVAGFDSSTLTVANLTPDGF